MDDTDKEVIELLKKSNAIITDSHIVGTSGRHLSLYINKDALYPYTSFSSRIGELFALKYKDFEIDVVAAPALGGIILSQWTAYHMSQLKKKDIFGVYTEKVESEAGEKNQVFRRGYDKIITGKNVLVVEDLTTTGGSVKKVIESVREAGGYVIAACVMVNRDPDLVNTETIGAPFSSLSVLKAESYTEEECPLCKKNVPINTSVGHGKEYLEAKAKKQS